MKLFVGTKYRHLAENGVGQILVLDINESLDASVLHESSEMGHMAQWGLAWDRDTLYDANLTKGVVEYNNRLDIKAEHKIEKFDGPGRNGKNLGTMFGAPHQKLKIGRKIYFVDSEHNEVKVFNIDTKKLVARKVFDDYVWINTLNYIDDQLHIVAHNMGKPSALIKADLDLNVIETVEGIGYAAHNVWDMDGDLWTCDSASGRLRTIDGLRHINIGGFTRGVAMNKDYLIAGISRDRQTIVDYGVDMFECPDKIAGRGGLAIIDRHTLEVVKYISLRGLTGRTSYFVQDMRLMDERDLASHLDDDNTPFSLDLLHE